MWALVQVQNMTATHLVLQRIESRVMRRLVVDDNLRADGRCALRSRLVSLLAQMHGRGYTAVACKTRHCSIHSCMHM